ncbi:metallophosphoesterase family protein [Jatrophihabitans endophyticus]|uniref:metallophosphoesterase family protein n=1 Tax=Jatrophihabitans endophyticus TaxID=1206085 RepID=UPI0019F3AE69|nr:metallophosphoesterase family protein [Jatrophihabitans endophyticus]MBE7189934.1 metallophosphoesterase [Jatrophihabitans endophyticus]
MSVVFYGDPHGEWRPLLRACQDERPDGVVILGDCDLDRPLRQQLEPLFSAGIRVRWIPGNHDVDTVEWHDRLWGDFPEGNLHGRWEQVGGLLVTGLGGIFKERVWYPLFDDAEPVLGSRRDTLRRIRPGDRWRGGLPLPMRDAIFPEDIRRSIRLMDVRELHGWTCRPLLDLRPLGPAVPPNQARRRFQVAAGGIVARAEEAASRRPRVRHRALADAESQWRTWRAVRDEVARLVAEAGP